MKPVDFDVGGRAESTVLRRFLAMLVSSENPSISGPELIDDRIDIDVGRLGSTQERATAEADLAGIVGGAENLRNSEMIAIAR